MSSILIMCNIKARGETQQRKNLQDNQVLKQKYFDVKLWNIS